MIFFQHLPIVVIVILKKRYILQSLIDFGGNYIYHDNHKKTEYNRICSDHMDLTMRQFLVKLGGMAFSFGVGIVGPTYKYFKYGIPSTTIEARVPFTEPKSHGEFAVNFILQTTAGTQGAVAFVGLEVFLSILQNAVTITPRLIENELMQTNQQYEKKAINEVELNVKFGNIVRQSQDADK